MGRVIVTPVGENLDSICAAMRAFPTDKVFLLCTGKYSEGMTELKKALETSGHR